MAQLGHYQTETIINKLKGLGLNLNDCRSQSQDNEATIASNNQKFKIKSDFNPLAIFVPCDDH